MSHKDELIWVSVKTNASKSEVIAYEDSCLKVRLKAIREKGKANKALIELLSSHFQVPKSFITIESGFTSPLKRIRIERY